MHHLMSYITMLRISISIIFKIIIIMILILIIMQHYDGEKISIYLLL